MAKKKKTAHGIRAFYNMKIHEGGMKFHEETFFKKTFMNFMVFMYQKQLSRRFDYEFSKHKFFRNRRSRPSLRN